MKDLDAWRVFVAVATAGSLTAAARHLGRSVPTVSKQIAALESWLGGPLFHRTSRRLGLTAMGETLLAEVRDPVGALEAITETVLDRDGALAGVIRLSAPISFSRLYLGAPLVSFMDRWPDVRIDLCLTDHRVDLVAEGLDLAIRLGNLPDSSLRVRRLCDIRMPLVAAPAQLSAAGVPRAPEDLRDRATIALAQVPDPTRWTFTHGTEGTRGLNIRPRLLVDNGDMAREAALAGLGFVILPDFFVHEDVRAGRLVEVLAPWRVRPIGLHVVAPPSRLRARRVAALIDHLAAAFARQAWYG
jgi:DNA-binding transcriptional LysR family regulator